MKRRNKVLILLPLVFALIAAVVYMQYPCSLLKGMVTLSRWWGGVERREIQVGEYRWVYLEGGKGDTVLLLHGFGLSKDQWGRLPAGLTGSYHVIAVDLPGFGENSRLPGRDYSVAAQAARVRGFVEKMGLKRFHLLGCSMGGGIAAYYAGEHPEEVISLALIGPLGIYKDSPGGVQTDDQKKVAMGLCVQNEADLDRVLFLAYDRPPAFPGRIKNCLVMLGNSDYPLHSAIFRLMMKKDVNVLSGRLSRIKAPALVIWGKKDRILPVSGAEIFHRGIAGSRLTLLDCGHITYVDEPEKTLAAYRDFLGSLKR